MKIDWNKIHEKALAEQETAKREAAFMMGAQITIATMSSMAFIYPDEIRNLFKTQKLVNYIQKRIDRSLQ